MESLSEEQILLIKVIIAYAEFVGFFIVVHASLCYYAFQLPQPGDHPVDWHQENHLKLESAATLSAHMAAFSLIRCCTMLMHFDFFQSSVYMCMVPVLFNTFVLVMFFRLSDIIRSGPPFYTPGGDNEGYDHWDEGAEEAENDVAKISLSFSAVVVLRFGITGQMANLEGLLIPLHEHDQTAKSMLWTSAFIFVCVTIAIILVKAQVDMRRASYVSVAVSAEPEHQEGLDSFKVYLKRWIYISTNTSATVFSWCTMFATKWTLHSFLLQYDKNSNPNSTLQRVVLSLIISFGSFIMVFFLDHLADMEWTAATADVCIKCIINAIAILVGFSWEQAFDAGVEVIAELSAKEGPWYPACLKLVLAIFVAIIMVPAWRKHLLKKTLEVNEATACICGCIYVPDAIYCHKCGREKTEEEPEEGNHREEKPEEGNHGGSKEDSEE
jgi:hypothetical protein